jgi:hypothetical protein
MVDAAERRGAGAGLNAEQDTDGTLMELTEANELIMLALPRGLEPLFFAVRRRSPSRH